MCVGGGRLFNLFVFLSVLSVCVDFCSFFLFPVSLFVICLFVVTVVVVAKIPLASSLYSVSCTFHITEKDGFPMS